MEHSIGVGAIIGLTLASSIYVWQHKYFSKLQKIVLLLCVVFPPAQWLGILGILTYYNYKVKNNPSKIEEKNKKIKLENSISNLSDLKEKGILSEEEYKQKIEKINAEKTEQDLKNSTEYKQLKSLLDSGVLTKEEFEDKITFIKVNTLTIKNKDYRIVDGFSEGIGLAINSDLDYGYVDESGKILIDFRFEHAENFINGTARVRDRGEFKTIDKKGNFI